MRQRALARLGSRRLVVGRISLAIEAVLGARIRVNADALRAAHARLDRRHRLRRHVRIVLGKVHQDRTRAAIGFTPSIPLQSALRAAWNDSMERDA